MNTPDSREEYLRHFAGDGQPTDRQREALKTALDIRKFEIELYWKRASYFWTFIAASFAGYFVLQKEDSQQSFPSTFVLTCLGFVFSLAWYFVNRGGKAWQRNWEIHVDLLEDEVMGPLYKSTMNRYSFNFSDLAAGYPFSPTNINHILGVFVIVVWLFLCGRSLSSADLSCTSHWIVVIGMSLITVCTVYFLATRGRTGRTDGRLPIHLRKRRYDDTGSSQDL